MDGRGDGAAKRYAGEVAYIYAYDVAYDMKRERVETLLGRPVTEYSLGPGKRGPRYPFFYRPQMVVLPPEERQTPRGGVVDIRRSVKIFAVGALSVAVRVSFEVDRPEDLIDYRSFVFQGVGLDDEVRQVVENARGQLGGHLIRPVAELGEAETYTVFCVHSRPAARGSEETGAERWLENNRRRVAGLLTGEDDSTHLSRQEAEESTGKYLSYYESDLVVTDWDAALVLGERDNLDDVLHIMEVANVQLLELEVYDRLLDASLEASYRDVTRWAATPTRRKVRLGLREIRVDLARLSDELVNISKFFGDWHLARIYRNLAERFHLADWHRTIDEKLRTLADLYELLQQDRINVWMVVLEATIVLLFIIDVVLLVMGLEE